MPSGDSFDALLQVVVSARASSTRPPVSATVATRDQRGHDRTATVYVDRMHQKWRMEENNGTVASDPKEGVIFQGVLGTEVAGKDRSDWLPPEISLFHPLQMRIWGAPMDDWRIVSASLENDHVHLALVSTFDESFNGHAVVNLEHGVVVDLERPPVRLIVADLQTSIQDGSSS